MTNVPAWLTRLVDVRRGEVRTLVPAFATLLLLIAGHTALETARDALLLTRVPARSLGVVYLAVALCVLPAAGIAARVTARLGVRRALGGGLGLAAAVLVVLFTLPATLTTVVALYVTSSLIGAVLVPLFWNLIGSIFTVAEGRRLLGPLGAAGVVGGTLGSGLAAAAVEWIPARGLLVVSAVVLLLAATALAAIPAQEEAAQKEPVSVVGAAKSSQAMRDEPFLRRIALLVVASTAATVALDYFFKWTVARDIPHADVAQFVARFYLLLNALSLAAQLFVSGALVRRIGAASAIVITPLVLLLGGVGALAAGGTMAAVLVLRAVDGMLINSVHRVTTELVYMPVPPTARTRAKPFIDGALARVTQAGIGALTLAAGSAGYLSARGLAAGVVVLVVGWLVVAVTTRRPYLGLLRRAVAKGGPDRPSEMDPIDLESAETLVEYLAHDDPLLVLGAMGALARRGRDRLVPAMILMHEDDSVLEYALTLFGASRREDWVGRARRLLGHAKEGIRMAAARALARHGRLAAGDLARDASPRVRGYAAALVALASAQADASVESCVKELLELDGHDGEDARIGLLLGLSDAPRDPRVAGVLERLAERAGSSQEWTEALAKAVSTHEAAGLIPQLVDRLALHDGREALRPALVSLGQPALDQVRAALADTSRPRQLRIHLPNTIARFGTADAAALLLQAIETEKDGLVRYKAIRGLGRMVSDGNVVVDRGRAEALSHANLAEHFRLLALRAPFDDPQLRVPTGTAGRAPTERLLVGLLDDKLRQSLERTFRLLKIAHPREDIHSVQIATASDDKRARANAGEFLDALLRRRDQRSLRDLLRVVADDLPIRERVARASAHVTHAPATRDEALAMLRRDRDATVVALAELHAAALAGESIEVAVPTASPSRRSVALATGVRAAAGLLAAEGSSGG